LGRRSVSVSHQERWVFNRLAEAYRSRPPYPDAILDRLAALGAGEVADLGAGTGLLSIPLAQRGLRVTAVEPARAMLSALEEGARCAGVAISAVHAAAEETGLPDSSLDLVTLADALQWVDPELAGAEIGRILRMDGFLAVIEPAFAETPFMRAVERAISHRNPRARRPMRDGALEQLFRVAVGAPPEVDLRIWHEVTLDDPTLSGVVRSLSFAGPALGEARLEDLEEEIRSAARRYGGAVWSREIRLALARRQR
jgi:ubiquinone/menaquinone biosynthesis C-methylase UbiE